MKIEDFVAEERQMAATRRLLGDRMTALAIGGVMDRLEEFLRVMKPAREPSYVVIWTYTDQFGLTRRERSGHHRTRDEARGFAVEKFARFRPEAWWIEERRVVEYHDPVRDARTEIRRP